MQITGDDICEAPSEDKEGLSCPGGPPVAEARQHPSPNPGHRTRPYRAAPPSLIFLSRTPPSSKFLGPKTRDSSRPSCVPLPVPEWIRPLPVSAQAAALRPPYSPGLPTQCPCLQPRPAPPRPPPPHVLQPPLLKKSETQGSCRECLGDPSVRAGLCCHSLLWL